MSKIASGQCLCKAVSVSFTLVDETFGACHCGMCQVWSGGPGLAVEAGKDVKFEGESSIQTYSSSEWGERGFCKNCGTHLFFRLKSGRYMNFQLGFLKGVDHLKFNSQIFIDKKAPNYSFANETKTMTEEEFFKSLG